MTHLSINVTSLPLKTPEMDLSSQLCFKIDTIHFLSTLHVFKNYVYSIMNKIDPANTLTCAPQNCIDGQTAFKL